MSFDLSLFLPLSDQDPLNVYQSICQYQEESFDDDEAAPPGTAREFRPDEIERMAAAAMRAVPSLERFGVTTNGSSTYQSASIELNDKASTLQISLEAGFMSDIHLSYGPRGSGSAESWRKLITVVQAMRGEAPFSVCDPQGMIVIKPNEQLDVLRELMRESDSAVKPVLRKASSALQKPWWKFW